MWKTFKIHKVAQYCNFLSLLSKNKKDALL